MVKVVANPEVRMAAELIELKGPVIGRRELRPPDIWSQADKVLTELSATLSDGSPGKRVDYRIVFSDGHVIEADLVVTEVDVSLAQMVRRNLELLAGRGSRPFYFTVRGRLIIGLAAYLDFLREARKSGSADKALHELQAYAVGDSDGKPDDETLANLVDARLAWEERTGHRGDNTEEDRVRLLRQRLELAEAFCRSLEKAGDAWQWPEGDAYARWREIAYPPGEFFKAPGLVVNSVEGQRLATRLALAEEVAEAAAQAQTSGTESEARTDNASLERALQEWLAVTAEP